MRAFTLVGLCSLLVGTGCELYSSGDDTCQYGAGSGGGSRIAVASQRNPESGQCESFGGGGPGCDPCGICPPTPGGMMPTWAFCDGTCAGLDESTCLATAGCRGIYHDDCQGPACDPARTYTDCWPTDQTGPIEGGTCDGLDAFSCSQHDDCIAVHASSCDGKGAGLSQPPCEITNFLSCAAEPATTTTCETSDTCGTGNHCSNEDGVCLPPPDCPPNGACAKCLGTCVPNPACADVGTETACIARTDCTPIYQGQDCTCDANGCVCKAWAYQRCQ